VTRVALVTGAAKRLGRSLAEDLAARGHRVVVNYRSSEGAAAEVVEGIRRRGGEARALRCDVGIADDVEAMFRSVADVEGRLDVLVNNVGIYAPRPVLELDPAQWDATIAANLSGPFYCCRAAVPLMVEGGSMVNLGYAGVDALVANPEAADYQVSKTGLLVLTKSLARALAPRGIRVNMISPGQLANSIDLPDDLKAEIPAGRAGTLEDIVRAVTFLLENAYVTGQNIDVAGGYRL
jgi:NAD(P)-dependent dehydrogenase (short-subunit alcohol dehydrogenase family)